MLIYFAGLRARGCERGGQGRGASTGTYTAPRDDSGMTATQALGAGWGMCRAHEPWHSPRAMARPMIR